MKKILIICLVVCLIANVVLAEDIVDTSQYVFKTNTPINLRVPCITSSNFPCDTNFKCNITISYPDTNILVANEMMTYNQTFFNYTIPAANVNLTGEYPTIVFCRNGTESGYKEFKFIVNSEGSTTSLNILFIIIGILIYAILIIGFVIKDPYMAMIASMGLVIIGIYIHLKGIADLKNFVTGAIALIHIAIGSYILLRTSMEKAMEELG